MPRLAALIVDAQRLHSHQNNSDQFLVLGLTLQFAFRPDPTNPLTAADLLWPQLWLWTRITHIDVWFDGAQANQELKTFPIWKLNPQGAEPTAPAKMITTLRKRVKVLYDEAKEAGFTWSPDNPDAATPMEGHILHLQAASTRVSTKLPYLLNLAVVVKVAKADIPYANNDIPHDAKVFATPRLKRQVGNLDISFTPQNTGPTEHAPGLWKWEYRAEDQQQNPVTDPALTSWLKPLELIAVEPNGVFVDLRKNLVRNGQYPSIPSSTPALFTLAAPTVPEINALNAGQVPNRLATEFLNHQLTLRNKPRVDVLSGTSWRIADGPCRYRAIHNANLDLDLHSENGPLLEAGEDWLGRIVEHVADRWDLPRHLLDAARRYVSLPRNDLVKYHEWVLAALRDRSLPGLIDSTDGNGLLKYSIQQLYSIQKEHSLSGEPSTLQRLVRDGQLRTLQAILYDRAAAEVDEVVGRWLKQSATILPADQTSKNRMEFTWPMNDPVLSPQGGSIPFFPVGRKPTIEIRFARQQNDPPVPLATISKVDGERTGSLERGGRFVFEAGAHPVPILIVPGWYQAVVIEGNVEYPSAKMLVSPTRQVSIRFSPNSPALKPPDANHPEISPLFPAAGEPVLRLKHFANRHTTSPIPSPIDQSDYYLGNQGWTARRIRNADGSAAVVFEAYDQRLPLPAGWYEIALVVGGGNPDLASERTIVAAGLASDLDVLDRIWSEVQKSETLSTLALAEWERMEADGAFLHVEPAATSRAWYTTIWTNVRPNQAVISRRVGEIRALDGRTWVLSLCDIRHNPAFWIDGHEYKCLFRTPDTNEDGTTVVPQEIEFVVRLKDDANGKHVLLIAGGNSLDIPAAGGEYHLRFELSRMAADRVKVATFAAVGNISVAVWISGPTLEMQGSVFGRVDFRIKNDLTGGFLCAPPSLLVAPESLKVATNAGPADSDLCRAWFATVAPGHELGSKAFPVLRAVESGGHSALAKLELLKRLSLGQTARLVTIWHRQLTPLDQLDYAKYLIGNRAYREGGPNATNAIPGKLPEQVIAYWTQRLAVTAQADYATSPYRDFFPSTATVPLVAETKSLVERHLQAVAWDIAKSLLGFVEASFYREQNADRNPMPIPHSLNIQVDRPAMFNDSLEAQTDTDFLRNIAGYGVLLRQGTLVGNAPTDPDYDPDQFFMDRPWQLLNCADIGALDSIFPVAPTQPSPPLLFEAAIGVGQPVTPADLAILNNPQPNQIPLSVRNLFISIGRPLQNASKYIAPQGSEWHIEDQADSSFYTLRDESNVLKCYTSVIGQWYVMYPETRHQAPPVSLQYQAQIRQVTITYRNKPLAAHSPLEDIAAAFNFGDDGLDVAVPPFMTFMSEPPVNGFDWGKLPVLRFGELYQGLVYVLGNCLNLPAILTKINGHPSMLRTTTLLDAELLQLSEPQEAPWPAASQFLHRFKYLRRVAVGLPRLQASEHPESLTSNSPRDSVLPTVPPDVRPLAREWGLRGLTPNSPSIRYYRDESTGKGELIPLESVGNWMLVVPRVTVAGRSDDDDGPAIAFKVYIGLRTKLSPLAGIVAGEDCGAVIERSGFQWTVTVNGSHQQELVLPSGLKLTSGPLDFRVAFVEEQLFVAWRRSDREESWTEWTPANVAMRNLSAVAGTPWIVIERISAANDGVVTFGKPLFVRGSITLTAGANPRPVDDGLCLMPLDSEDIPILLPSTNTRPFYLRLPATDLETWDAWPKAALLTEIGGGVTEQELRRSVCGRKQLLTGLDDKQYDAALDDPAVIRLRVELVPLLADETLLFQAKIGNGQPISPADIGVLDNAQPGQIPQSVRNLFIGVQRPLQNPSKIVTVAGSEWRIEDRPNQASPSFYKLCAESGVLKCYQTELQTVIEEWSPTLNLTAIDPLDQQQLDLDPLRYVQHRPAKFTVLSYPLPSDKGAFQITQPRLEKIGNGNEFKIHVREQEIWELRVYPLTKIEAFNAAEPPVPGKQLFHSAFGEGAAVDTNSHRAFTPWTLVIEAPTRAVVEQPTLKQLLGERDAISSAPIERRLEFLRNELRDREALLLAALRPRFDGRSVVVALEKPSPRAFRYAGQIRLVRQVWRWRGRPLPPFPFAGVHQTATGLDQIPPNYGENSVPQSELQSPSYPMLWDAAGFGDRSPVDILDNVRSISSELRFGELFREELGTDNRSLYYRFTAQAMSRYAGLFLNDPPVVMASEHLDKPGPDPRRNAWRRLLVPCRREEKPSRPSIRFVVPLTQSEEDAPVGRVPGFIVVCDDPWFAFGGLGETLEVEVIRTSDWWDTGYQDKSPVLRPEFGPDPIVTGKGWTKRDIELLDLKPQTQDNETQELSPPDRALSMDVVGPIGHTFDTDADAPFFNASSFIVRPPATTSFPQSNGAESLAWYFAKIRFRRALPAETLWDYRAETPVPSSTDVESPIPGSEAPDFQSRSWVIDVPRIEVDRATFEATEITVSNPLDKPSPPATPSLGRGICRLSSEQIQGDGQIFDVLKIGWTSTNPGGGNPSLELWRESSTTTRPWTRASVGIRFVLQLETEQVGNRTELLLHLSVQIRLNGIWTDPTRTGEEILDAAVRRSVWHNLQSHKWKGIWPTKIKVATSGSAEISPPLVFPCRNSDFTPPHWVQFLPDGNELIGGLLKGEERRRFGLTWQRAFDFRIQKPTNERFTPPSDADTLLHPNGSRVNPRPSNVALAGKTIRVDYHDGTFRNWEYNVYKNSWLLQPPRFDVRQTMIYGQPTEWPIVSKDFPAGDIAGEIGSEVRRRNRVLLTELVSDVRGQLGEERYLGLYHRTETSSGNVVLEEVHRSPVLGPFLPFGNLSTSDRRLRIRIVEFQVVDIQNERKGPAAVLGANVWNELFPKDQQAKEDATARIVRVSPPIELTEYL